MPWGRCYKERNRVHCENSGSPDIYIISRQNGPAPSNKRLCKFFWIAASVICVVLVAALVSLVVIFALKNNKKDVAISSFTTENHTALPLIFLSVQNISSPNLNASTFSYIDYDWVTDLDAPSKINGGGARNSPKFRLIPITQSPGSKTTAVGAGGDATSVNLFSGNHTSGKCKLNEFSCESDATCIARQFSCNKIRDCADGSDEIHCSCVDFLRTLTPEKICDFVPDCVNFEDEENCPNACKADEFRCHITSTCLKIDRICNGISDCADGEDEKNCFDLQANGSETAEGILVLKIAGGRNWNAVCFDDAKIENKTLMETMNSVCGELGFGSLLNFEHRSVSPSTQSLPVSLANLASFTANVSSKPCATGNLFLKCESGSFSGCTTSAECRQENRPRQERIVGGEPTGFACHPWAAALYREGTLTCMGVVYDTNWLLTAAHCFKSKEHQYWIARIGFSRQLSHSPYEEVRRIVEVISHPDFSDVPWETNDLALVRLDHPVVLSAYIQPPCLPREDQLMPNSAGPQPGERCTVIGWGYLSETVEEPVDNLQSVQLKVMEPNACNNTESYRGSIRRNHLCLIATNGAKPQDACQGDSGGALLCPSPDGRTQYLAGITSTGFGCGRPGIPSLWTKLVDFLPWIRQTVQNPQGSRPVGTDSNCQGFRCRLGDCIFNWLRCDAQYDCSMFDGSDEAECNYNKGISSSTNRALFH